MTDQDERTLMAGLRALKEASQGDGASDRIRAAVLKEFRSAQVKRRSSAARWWWTAGMSVAAAAALIFAIALQLRRAPEPVTRVVAKQDMPAPAVVAAAVAPAVAAKPRTVARAHHGLRKTRPSVQPSVNVGDDFLPVVSAPPLVEGEHASVMRVELPRASLRAFGFPVIEERRYERVNADVVVGQDGLIRAVRFLH